MKTSERIFSGRKQNYAFVFEMSRKEIVVEVLNLEKALQYCQDDKEVMQNRIDVFEEQVRKLETALIQIRDIRSGERAEWGGEIAKRGLNEEHDPRCDLDYEERRLSALENKDD